MDGESDNGKGREVKEGVLEEKIDGGDGIMERKGRERKCAGGERYRRRERENFTEERNERRVREI